MSNCNGWILTLSAVQFSENSGWSSQPLCRILLNMVEPIRILKWFLWCISATFSISSLPTMQFLCLNLSSEYLSYWIPQNQQNIAQNLYFIKCAVLTLVPPPFRFPLHKIQNPIFQLSCLSKHVHHMFIKPYTGRHLDLWLT